VIYNLRKEGQFDVVDTDNANDALILLEDVDIDLILLDLMLPGLSGSDFLKLIKGKDELSEIPIIIISAKKEERDIISQLRSGADDYLTKPFSIKVLIAKVEAVLRRSRPGTQVLYTYQSISLNTETHKAYIQDSEVRLTQKEYELLLLFLKKPQKVFHRNQLLNTVWGYEADIYTRTVDTHIFSLRKKLGHQGQLIKSIPKIGYGLDI
jgi:two-component system phosphate regulon response regulator PhoB